MNSKPFEFDALIKKCWKLTQVLKEVILFLYELKAFILKFGNSSKIKDKGYPVYCAYLVISGTW